MGLLESVLGGVAGAETLSLVSGLIEKHGGVPGLLAQLHSQGLRETAKSWVESGPKLPISSDQIHQVFGTDTIKDLAAKAGMDPQVAAQKISQLLPQAIDRLTLSGSISGA